MNQYLIYGLLGTGGLWVLFMALFIRSAVKNGKLKDDLKICQRIVDEQKRQLEISANPNVDPADLLKRMRENKL